MVTQALIFDTSIEFESKAVWIYEFQRKKNKVYSAFCEALAITNVTSMKDIPLLPIQAFKETEVISPPANFWLKTQSSKLFFQSSGTSGMERSRHYILVPKLYRFSLKMGMEHFYHLDEYVIWAYTPGYAENPHSSLIWMLNTLIEDEPSGLSRFLELNHPIFPEEVEKITQSGKKLMLFGAAFGLLDVIEKAETKLPPDTIIIETGGMKTQRREISRADLHQSLATGFGLPESHIHSEYGMTELLSQAYSLGDEWFQCVPWMQVSIRNPQNPMEEVPDGTEGLIGVIDLANMYSCSFILTGDKGIRNGSGHFQVLGRWQPNNLRGCNFLIDQD